MLSKDLTEQIKKNIKWIKYNTEEEKEEDLNYLIKELQSAEKAIRLILLKKSKTTIVSSKDKQVPSLNTFSKVYNKIDQEYEKALRELSRS
mgnify:CR=1 FL=1